MEDFEREVRKRVCRNVAQHRDTWIGQDEYYWLSRLIAEVGEFSEALNKRHEHTPDQELEEIAGIVINWLYRRASGWNSSDS